jgi:ABC-type nitrate/sulfonate/bicarbonate transport system permease component
MNNGARTRGARPVTNRQLAFKAASCLGVVLVLVLWQLLAVVLRTGVLPSFTVTASAAVSLLRGPELSADILPSIGRALIGFLIASAIGIAIGLVLGHIRWLGSYCSAVLDYGRSVPSPLLVPLAIVVFGEGSRMVIVMIVVAVVWPVLVNAWDGVRRIEPLYLDAARACGLHGRAIFTHVLIPATLPPIFAGLRLALSTSLLVLVVAEYLGGNSGIGFLMSQAQQNFQISDVFACALILIVLGWLFDTVFLFAERRLLRWEKIKAAALYV